MALVINRFDYKVVKLLFSAIFNTTPSALLHKVKEMINEIVNFVLAYHFIFWTSHDVHASIKIINKIVL